MIDFILRKILGTKNERELKRLRPIVGKINALEPQVERLTDAELRAKTEAFKSRLREATASLHGALEEVRAQMAAASGEEREELKTQGEKLENERRQAETEILDEILPEAFATVREVGRRVLQMRHFDVQLVGGIVLHEGKIAEMATGEGKTLVATLPAYLNALLGRGVHIVTVNDYLAKRDTQWMGPIYHTLGLSVGVLQHEASYLFDPSYRASDPRMANLRPCQRKEAYLADITYGTNNEFGFDYLRDNMKFTLEEMVQRELFYVIVDEVDNILIDEARTPLIISGPSEEAPDLYYQIDRIVRQLKRAATITEGKLSEVEATVQGDYIVDEKHKTVALTEAGIAKAEQLIGVRNLYDPSHMELVHHINQALKAHNLFKRDVDYMVKDGEVIIVDEFTGRLMPGRRWSDGLHQAVEAKERVKIERENQTLATITIQNYFRMYKKLAGMTGTADTEAAEFAQIYNLDVVVIPTNRPLIRTNHPDVVYRTEREKYDAIVKEIEECNQIGRPVLVGTTSIEKSEKLSAMLKRKGILHQVLNAKHHEREAEIVAQAGRFKSVTIATNMAGRGTDILLGGNPSFLATEWVRRREVSREGMSQEEYEKTLAEVKKMQAYGLLDTPDPEAYAAALVKARKETEEEHKRVVALGGLHILGTERHEARRIDNQLRGRAGRQGDPGSSRFYLSLEDDLMRLFASDRISRIMGKLGMEEGEPIEHPWVTKAIQTAQKRVEAHNFEIRKHLLEYDDVMNKQRQVIYAERRRILESEDLKDHIQEMIGDVLDQLVETYTDEDTYPEQWDFPRLSEAVKQRFDVELSFPPEEIPELTQALVRDRLDEILKGAYEAKEQKLGSPTMRFLERMILLQVVDSQWKDHLLAMDHLKEGIGLRGYGQKDPLIEYKREGFDLFEEMIERIKGQAVEYLFKVQLAQAEVEEVGEPAEAIAPSGDGRRRSAPMARRPLRSTAAAPATPALRVGGKKIGRNDPCPCGSGRKYKKCCGA